MHNGKKPLHVIVVRIDIFTIADWKSISKCMHERDLCCLLYLRKQILEVGHLNHLDEYILRKNCFHMIFQAQDLPTVAGMRSVSQRSPRKTFVLYHIQERKTVT